MVATLKVASGYREPLPNIVELKAPGNVEVSQGLCRAARQWLHLHDLSQINMRRRDWGTAPLDRATWTSLWRPYRLAQRHVPG